jgi:Ca2+-binding RTX toxin-like protein
VTTSTAWTPQVLLRPDNRTVYVAGLNSNGSGGFQNTLFVAGLTPKGKPDHVFGKHLNDGVTETWGQAALQRDGRLVVAGNIPPLPPSNNAVFRFTRKGTLDPAWNGTGVITLTNASDTIGLGITPKGRIILGQTLDSGPPYDAQLLAFRGTRTPSCHGKLATQFGGKKADTIIGTSGKDVLVGMGGQDVLKGLGGDDVLCGNAGNDTLVGGPGHDVLDGGGGTNVLKP